MKGQTSRCFFLSLQVRMLLHTSAIFLISFISVCAATKCVPRYYGSSSIVCVCNETYCDTFPPVENGPGKGHYLHYISSKSGKRFEVCSGKFSYKATEAEECKNN